MRYNAQASKQGITAPFSQKNTDMCKRTLWDNYVPWGALLMFFLGVTSC